MQSLQPGDAQCILGQLDFQPWRSHHLLYLVVCTVLYCSLQMYVRTYLGHWCRVPIAAARRWAAQLGCLFMLCNVKVPELYVRKSYDF